MDARRAVALIGDPVAHSVSPAMHRAAFAAAGLGFDYEAIRVPLDYLPRTFADLRRTMLGLNVTAPLKEAVIPLLDALSSEAEEAGSVNTVTFGDEGQAVGHSTDGIGFLAALRKAGAEPGERAVVLGTGGAARAVLVALRSRGIEVSVWGRNAQAGSHLALLGGRFLPATDTAGLAQAVGEAGLLVNATPLGAWPHTEASPLPERIRLRPSMTVMDLVYRPRRTSLLLKAESAGCRCVPGVEMLIEQGARSFELWTGIQPRLKVMRTVAYQALQSAPESSPPPLVGAKEGG